MLVIVYVLDGLFVCVCVCIYVFVCVYIYIYVFVCVCDDDSLCNHMFSTIFIALCVFAIIYIRTPLCIARFDLGWLRYQEVNLNISVKDFSSSVWRSRYIQKMYPLRHTQHWYASLYLHISLHPFHFFLFICSLYHCSEHVLECGRESDCSRGHRWSSCHLVCACELPEAHLCVCFNIYIYIYVYISVCVCVCLKI